MPGHPFLFYNAVKNEKVKVLVTQSCLTLVTPWTVAHQDPLSMGFSRQEYWSGLPFPSPGDLPNPGTEPGSPSLQSDSLPSEPLGMLLKINSHKMVNVIFWGFGTGEKG